MMDLKYPMGLFSIFLVALFSVTASSSVTITTQMGEFIGQTAEVTVDKTEFEVDTFLGIPYAKPPVDN